MRSFFSLSLSFLPEFRMCLGGERDEILLAKFIVPCSFNYLMSFKSAIFSNQPTNQIHLNDSIWLNSCNLFYASTSVETVFPWTFVSEFWHSNALKSQEQSSGHTVIKEKWQTTWRSPGQLHHLHHPSVIMHGGNTYQHLLHLEKWVDAIISVPHVFPQNDL